MPTHRHDHAQPTDAIAILQADHRWIKDLFAQYEATRNPATKRTLAEHVFVELETHAQLEENVFYPAVNEETDEGPELVKDSLSEHEMGAFILQRHRRPWFSIPLLSPVWSAVFSSRNQFQVGTSRRHLGEFGLVIALILLGFMERPIRIEIAIDH